MSVEEYEAQKEAVADQICKRLEALWPGLRQGIEFREVNASQPCRALGLQGVIRRQVIAGRQSAGEECACYW
jgi:hypothetical protein